MMRKKQKIRCEATQRVSSHVQSSILNDIEIHRCSAVGIIPFRNGEKQSLFQEM